MEDCKKELSEHASAVEWELKEALGKVTNFNVWYDHICAKEMELCCRDVCRICAGGAFKVMVPLTRELRGDVAYWFHHTLICEASKIRERFYKEHNGNG